jgi:hypothetical protein
MTLKAPHRHLAVLGICVASSEWWSDPVSARPRASNKTSNPRLGYLTAIHRVSHSQRCLLPGRDFVYGAHCGRDDRKQWDGIALSTTACESRAPHPLVSGEGLLKADTDEPLPAGLSYAIAFTVTMHPPMRRVRRVWLGTKPKVGPRYWPATPLPPATPKATDQDFSARSSRDRRSLLR